MKMGDARWILKQLDEKETTYMPGVDLKIEKVDENQYAWTGPKNTAIVDGDKSAKRLTGYKDVEKFKFTDVGQPEPALPKDAPEQPEGKPLTAYSIYQRIKEKGETREEYIRTVDCETKWDGYNDLAAEQESRGGNVLLALYKGTKENKPKRPVVIINPGGFKY